MESTDTLREWVRAHRVTWEMDPARELVGTEVRAVGFELRLFGQHEGHGASPGCGACVALHAKLAQIAAAALPTDRRATEFEIEPFDHSFHLRPESDWVAEVELTVRIVHREDYLGPLDACESRCAEEIRKELSSLGVRPKAWERAVVMPGWVR